MDLCLVEKLQSESGIGVVMILEDIINLVLCTVVSCAVVIITALIVCVLYQDFQLKKEERAINKLELCEKMDNKNLSRALLGINNLHFRNDEEY